MPSFSEVLEEHIFVSGEVHEICVSNTGGEVFVITIFDFLEVLLGVSTATSSLIFCLQTVGGAYLTDSTKLRHRNIERGQSNCLGPSAAPFRLCGVKTDAITIKVAETIVSVGTIR